MQNTASRLANMERGRNWDNSANLPNNGRALFPGDKEFGEWVALCQLDTADRHDRASAMWAAANADQFEEARQRGAYLRNSADRLMITVQLDRDNASG